MAIRQPGRQGRGSAKTIKVLRPNCKVELKSFLPVALNGGGGEEWRRLINEQS